MSSTTITRTTVVTVTAARVADVLRQVRVDFINAERAGLTASQTIRSWIDDLTQMLLANALSHFELRVVRGNSLWRAWRYVVSDDGSLQETGRGGGIDFFDAPSGAVATLTICSRLGLPAAVSQMINDLGWTSPVAPLEGNGVRERAFSKDGYGVIRTRFGG